MNEIDRIFQKYRNSRIHSDVFLLPEFGGKTLYEILVATFLKQQELQEYMVDIMEKIRHIIERQHLLINNFDEEIGKLKKRLNELQRTNRPDKDEPVTISVDIFQR